MTTLSLHRLCVDLDRRRIVSDVNADFESGAFVGVVGPNGAGKTTLVKAMAGLLPPSAGVVMLGDRPLPAWRAAARARMISYLPQSGQVHWPLSVERLVAIGRLPHLSPFARANDADRVAIQRAMARADVAHLAERPITSLSGGERALALVARAIAVEAEILIADEPAASLDPAHQLQVLELLLEEAAAGRIVVGVMHDLGLARRFCKRLLLVSFGRVVADGSPADVLTVENLKTVFGVEALVTTRDGVPTVTVLRRVRRV